MTHDELDIDAIEARYKACPYPNVREDIFVLATKVRRLRADYEAMKDVSTVTLRTLDELIVAYNGVLSALVLAPHVDKEQAVSFLREVIPRARAVLEKGQLVIERGFFAKRNS